MQSLCMLVFIMMGSGVLYFAHLGSGYTTRPPILIEGNGGFTGTNGVTGGSGTALDPYIIEGWEIDSSSARGIQVSNTTAHFTIRNSYVHGSGPTSYGIYLVNVTNAGIRDNELSMNQVCVYARNSNQIDIQMNNVSNATVGVFLYSTSDSVLFKNTMKDNGQAVRLWNASRNVVEENTLRLSNIGLKLESYSSLNNVNANTISNNTVGISISSYDSSDNNTLTFNLIANNSQDGVTISQSYNNTMYSNTFVDNARNAFDYTNGLNQWNESYPIGGNYWHDYSGVDGDGDGIGDTAYDIPGPIGVGGTDYLPLVDLPSDRTPPAKIVDLAASSPTVDSIALTWTAPGDDGTSGRAAAYEVKYSTAGQITESNWPSASVFSQSWSPLTAGSIENRIVKGLDEGTQYWFAVKARDEIPNWSQISNSPSGTTLADTTRPVIADLRATPSIQSNNGFVNISANITDDGTVAGAWVVVTGPSGALISNNSMSFHTTDARFFFSSAYSASGAYTYAVWATDAAGNWASASGTFEIAEVKDGRDLSGYLWIMILVIILVVVVGLVFALRKRKSPKPPEGEPPSQVM